MIHCKLFQAFIPLDGKEWEAERWKRSYWSDESLQFCSFLFFLPRVRTRVGSNIFRITNEMMSGSFHFKPRRGLEISSPTITLSIHERRTVVRRSNEFPRSYCHRVVVFPLWLVM